MVVDDEQLAGLASQGDQEALAALAVRHRRWIYTVAYRIALREPDALDITQNVLLKLVSAIRSYQVPGNFRAWLTVLT
ncbi:MAG: RNA polymerase sigma factor, partial [Candidatus Omnitrophica bacterium]|nr:RNA polymerase sigma factor [Candidatus Omnitrophota bacterium]